MGAAPWDRKSVANQSSSIKSRRGWRPTPIPPGRGRPPACAGSLPREERKRWAFVTGANTFFLPSRPERELLLNNAGGPAKQEMYSGQLARNVAGLRRLGHARCSGFVIGEDGTHTQVREL